MTKDHGPQIKDDERYEALRERGYAKSKAARIANTPDAAEKGGHAGAYEGRSVAELRAQAARVGVRGRSKMTKAALIEALRG